MAAAAGSSVITPLTTVAAQLISKEIQSLNRQPTDSEFVSFVNQANAKVQQAFNLGNVDISNFDPLEVLNNPVSSQSEIQVALNVQKISASIANIIVKVSQSGTNAAEYLSASSKLTADLATKVSALNGSALDLSDSNTS